MGMKYKASYWLVLKIFIKRYLKKIFTKDIVKRIFKNAKAEYKNLLSKADNIGENNPMASNLYGALLFVSFLRGNPDLFNKEMLKEMMEQVFLSPIFVKFRSMDFNNEKHRKKFIEKMHNNSDWAIKHKNKYPQTWEFNFDDSHRDGCYYYFTKCPIAKFFKENNMEDLTEIFCQMDYINISLRKGRLIRNKTLAKGDDICDFWIVGDKTKNPK